MKLLALLFLYSSICYRQNWDVKTLVKPNMKNKIYSGRKRGINNINEYLNTTQHI